MQLEDYATGWWDAAEGRGHQGNFRNKHYSEGYSAGLSYLDTNLENSVRLKATPLN